MHFDIHIGVSEYTYRMYQFAKEGWFVHKVTTKEKDGRIVSWNYVLKHNETGHTRKLFVKQDD